MSFHFDLDFNTAAPSTGFGELIPDNTVAVAIMRIRPGGAGPEGLMKANKEGTALGLDAEFTIVGGPFDKRKFWSWLTVAVDPSATDGQRQAVSIARTLVRGIIESARGIRPADDSEGAIAARQIPSYRALDGMAFCAKVGIEKGKDGYADKNKLRDAVTIDSKAYLSPTGPQQAGSLSQGSTQFPTFMPRTEQTQPQQQFAAADWAR